MDYLRSRKESAPSLSTKDSVGRCCRTRHPSQQLANRGINGLGKVKVPTDEVIHVSKVPCHHHHHHHHHHTTDFESPHRDAVPQRLTDTSSTTPIAAAVTSPSFPRPRPPLGHPHATRTRCLSATEEKPNASRWFLDKLLRLQAKSSSRLQQPSFDIKRQRTSSASYSTKASTAVTDDARCEEASPPDSATFHPMATMSHQQAEASSSRIEGQLDFDGERVQDGSGGGGGGSSGPETWRNSAVSDAGMGWAFSTMEDAPHNQQQQQQQQQQQKQQQQQEGHEELQEHQEPQQQQERITYQPAYPVPDVSLRASTASDAPQTPSSAQDPTSRSPNDMQQSDAMLSPRPQTTAIPGDARRRRKDSQVRGTGVSNRSLMPSQRRIYGLDRDLAGPSADSAHLPPSSGGIRYNTSSSSRRPFGASSSGAEIEPSRVSTSSSDDGTSWHRAVNNGQARTPMSLLPTLVTTPTTDGSPAPSIILPFDVGVDAPGASTLPPSPISPDEGPKFSVEVVAPAFDRRGYPVFTGRGARISGMVRIKAVEQCQLSIKLAAYVSQGSPAAVWNGVALMPPEQGAERNVFEIQERLIPDYSKAQLSPARSSIPTPEDDDYIVPVPFEINLPLGMATKFVDGEMQNVPVALPPSFEISSESDAREKDANRAMSSLGSMPRSSASSIRSKSSRMTMSNTMQSVSNKVRGVVERGFAEVFRIGCFYTLTFSILRPDDASSNGKKKKTKKASSKKSTSQNDSITIPFIFLGEPTMLPPPPPSIPMSMVASVLLQPEALLGDQWMCERSQTKWTGSMFRSSKRTVELELHMPQPATLHAPGVFPFLIVIRPTDPYLLSAVEGPLNPGMGRQTVGASSSSSSQAPDSPRSLRGGSHQFSSSSGISPSPSFGHSPQSSMSMSTTARIGPSNLGISQDHSTSEEAQEMMRSTDSPPSTADGAEDSDGILSRFMRSSLTLARIPSKSTLPSSGSSTNLAATSADTAQSRPSTVTARRSRTSLASAFRRRPNTAPTTSSDSRSPPGTVTYRAGMPHNLASLVRVSLIQSTHCVSSGPSETPKRRRKLISMADVEEVDVATVFTGGSHSEAAALGRGDVASDEATQAVVSHVKSHGIRVLRGLIRVSRDTTPSFRCQGIEVKYAVKIDLLAFSPEQLKQQKRPTSGGSSSVGSGGSSTLMGDAFRGTFGTASRNSLSSTLGRSSRAASQHHQQQQQLPHSESALQQQGNGLNVGAESPLVLPRPMGMPQPHQQRTSSSSNDVTFSPPMPPIPPEHQQHVQSPSHQHRSQMPSLSSATSTIRGLQRENGSYAPTEIGGLDAAGRMMGPNTFFKATTGVGGGTTVFGGDGKEVRLDKGIGALWADVRVVRAAFA